MMLPTMATYGYLLAWAVVGDFRRANCVASGYFWVPVPSQVAHGDLWLPTDGHLARRACLPLHSHQNAAESYLSFPPNLPDPLTAQKMWKHSKLQNDILHDC